MSHDRIEALTNKDLLSCIRRLAAQERAATVAVLRYLIEIERRKLHLTLGYESMFDYCTRELGYSSSAAGRRVQAARCIRRFPAVEHLLAKNAVTLSTISLFGPVLRNDNAELLLKQVQGKSQREVELLVAQYRPPVRLRDRVRPVAVAVTVDDSAQAPMLADAASTPTRGGSASYEHSRSEGEAPHGQSSSGSAMQHGGAKAGHTLQPTTAHGSAAQGPNGHGSAPRVRIERKLLIQFLAGPDFMRVYNEAQALLSTRIPRASFESVFKAALEEFVERHSPKRRKARRDSQNERRSGKARRDPQQEKPSGTARVKQPDGRRPSPWAGARSAGTALQQQRHIPAAVRDEVYTRDGGRCTFVGRNGVRCSSRHNIHIDHIEPFAMGGSNEVSNLRLLCANHNRLVAERLFGENKIAKFADASRQVTDSAKRTLPRRE